MLTEAFLPAGVESSRLDDRRLDVPRWNKLFVQRFGKPFQSFCRSGRELQWVAIKRNAHQTFQRNKTQGRVLHCIPQRC